MPDAIIMQLEMKLAEAKKMQHELKLKITRNFYELDSLRMPFFDSAEEIKAEEIEQAADDLLRNKNELIAVENRIKEIKERLGRN